MISVTLPHTVMQDYADELAINVMEAVTKLLNNHNNKKERLLKCEVQFYKAILIDTKVFLGKKPAAIETYLADLCTANPDFAVLAAGAFAPVSRHINKSAWPRYERLWDRHDSRKKVVCKCLFCKVSARARKAFSWSAFMDKDKTTVPPMSIAGRFIKSVGLSICPYCSRNHVAPLTAPTRTIYSPDLDHFFAQSIYPYFRLCVYNLIPSCSACNCRIKGAADFLGNGYLHPYAHTAPDQLFVLDGIDVVNVKRIDPAQTVLRLAQNISRRAKKSALFFHLPLAYQGHLEQACHFAESLRLIPDAVIDDRARLLKVDPAYLKLILHRSVDPADDSYKHRVLGRLMHDMELMFKKV